MDTPNCLMDGNSSLSLWLLSCPLLLLCKGAYIQHPKLFRAVCSAFACVPWSKSCWRAGCCSALALRWGFVFACRSLDTSSSPAMTSSHHSTGDVHHLIATGTVPKPSSTPGYLFNNDNNNNKKLLTKPRSTTNISSTSFKNRVVLLPTIQALLRWI